MTLMDQLKEVAIRRVNEPWWNSMAPPRCVDNLCALAFVENWDRDGHDAKVILRCADNLKAMKSLDGEAI